MILNDPFGASCRHTHVALAGSLAGLLRSPLGTLDGCPLGLSLIAPRAGAIPGCSIESQAISIK
jgi:hypothetical protein